MPFLELSEWIDVTKEVLKEEAEAINNAKRKNV